MSVFKCKMCGGTIEYKPGDTVGVCDSCGTKQTLPRLDDERRANLYDRANHFRRANEFDKAAGLFEQILNEDGTDAEAYWSLVLCRYGVEYVEDPRTHRRVPTVNRAQFTSIFDDEDYKSALKFADGYQKSLYEQEAAEINEIQRGILQISRNEKPFDIFICYKETDANGRRTQDSVLANDLYHQLTQEGFKVFFSRITLEDKLGTAYEPYIFAALNSAKVMVVLGTRPEYFNAVWVKNEWSRYLTLVKASKGKKVLIPAYRDMDPYDLPEEFSHLQAQDMSRLGFMQDLIRGIKKIVGADEPKPAGRDTVVINSAAPNVAPLLKRAFLFLEEGEWDRADDFCEQVLNSDPENAEAYLAKLLVEKNVHRREDLADCSVPFEDSKNYRNAIRFGDDALADELNGYILRINERIEEENRRAIYDKGVSALKAATTEVDIRSAEKLLDQIRGYRDTEDLLELCEKRIEDIREKEEQAWLEAERKAEEKRLAAAKAAKTAKKGIGILAGAAVVVVAIVLLVTKLIIPEQNYKKALRLAETGQYLEAAAAFEQLGDYKDSAYQVTEMRYSYATALEEAGKLDEAASAFEALGDYKDSADQARYSKAVALFENEEFEAAYTLLSGLNFKDSAELLQDLDTHLHNIVPLAEAEVGTSVVFGTYEQDNDLVNGKEPIQWLVLDKKDGRLLVISRYALDYLQFHNKRTNTTWETCDLRKWMNKDFYSTAFTADEQAKIYKTVIKAETGKDTEDKVFLLSTEEVKEYFDSKDARRCEATDFVRMQGGFTNGYCTWWLRSPGYYGSYAASVGSGGRIDIYGNYVEVFIAMRPAMWINLS